MRWLLIVLLVSLAAMLIAAIGMVRYIWLQRARSRSRPSTGVASATGQTEESDTESEI